MGCGSATTHHSAHPASVLQEPDQSAIVIRAYTTDLAGIRAANPDVRLRVDRDPLVDIRNTRAISGVWIAGNPVKR